MLLTVQMGERCWPLHPPGGKLGRNQGLSITIPDETVSGEHAEFTWDAASASWWIRPLRPNNPVYLNGQELPLVRLPLPLRGELIFGRVAVQFSCKNAGAWAKNSAPPTLGPIQIKPGTQVPPAAQAMRGEGRQQPPEVSSAARPRDKAPPTELVGAAPAFLRSPEGAVAKPSLPRTEAPDGSVEIQQKLQRSQRARERFEQLARQAGGVFALLATLCLFGWLVGARLASQ